MTEIRVPTLGESVTEATIGKWFKQRGDVVAADEPLVELETDKVTIEVPAPAAGVLSEILAKDGETVAVGALLGQISQGDGARASVSKSAEPFLVLGLSGRNFKVKAQQFAAGISTVISSKRLTGIFEQQAHEVGSRRPRDCHIEDQRQSLSNGRILIKFLELRFVFRFLRIPPVF